MCAIHDLKIGDDSTMDNQGTVTWTVPGNTSKMVG